MPIVAPSSVSSTSRTSSVVAPSGRRMIQSAPPGSTLPLQPRAFERAAGDQADAAVAVGCGADRLHAG